jgi:hypothetical protein
MCFSTSVATYIKIMMKMSCDVITAVLFKGEDSGCMKRGEINRRSSYGNVKYVEKYITCNMIMLYCSTERGARTV